jgi:hypothetical protein
MKLLVPHEERIQKCPLCQKILLTFIWDKEVPIREYYQKKTVKSATCSAMFVDKLKPAICNKRRGLL